MIPLSSSYDGLYPAVTVGTIMSIQKSYPRSSVKHSTPGGRAVTLARRRSSCSSACSPKYSPLRRVLTRISSPSSSRFVTTTVPPRIM